MITTMPAARRGRICRHAAAWGCALAVGTLSGLAPAQALAGTGAPAAGPAARAAAATPRGRVWAAFAYYPPKNEFVLFGGRRPGTVFGDTWTRTGSTWTQRHPAVSPTARTGAAM